MEYENEEDLRYQLRNLNEKRDSTEQIISVFLERHEMEENQSRKAYQILENMREHIGPDDLKLRQMLDESLDMLNSEYKDRVGFMAEYEEALRKQRMEWDMMEEDINAKIHNLQEE